MTKSSYGCVPDVGVLREWIMISYIYTLALFNTMVLFMYEEMNSKIINLSHLNNL